MITDVGGLGRHRFAVDEAGGRRVAYQNASGLIAVRDVTRLDTTAPVTAGGQIDQSPAVASAEPVEVHFAESWSDPAHGLESASGLATVDVRRRCFSSRGRDEAGNISDWSEPQCTLVDGVKPTLGSVSGPARFDAVREGGLVFGYGATDDFGVASYDVSTRVANPGRLPGAWSDRASETTDDELTVRAAPGSEWCVRFRARDAAGHVTDWSGPR